MKKRVYITFFEIGGSVSAMAYALLIASNTGNEHIGFFLLFVSACLFAVWGIIDKRWFFVLLQVFYISSSIIGLVRWW